jgi:hypothetical protein
MKWIDDLILEKAKQNKGGTWRGTRVVGDKFLDSLKAAIQVAIDTYNTRIPSGVPHIMIIVDGTVLSYQCEEHVLRIRRNHNGDIEIIRATINDFGKDSDPIVTNVEALEVNGTEHIFVGSNEAADLTGAAETLVKPFLSSL